MSTDAELMQNELFSLKDLADQMGVAYHPSIGLDKLKEKVAAAKAAADGADEKEPLIAPLVPVESAGEMRQRLKREAFELIRVRLTCMNPSKKDWQGEIFTVGNSLVGSVTKYVPFIADEGWHVPRILLEMLKERQCQIFVNSKTKGGVTMREGKLIKEFAIEILSPLTEEEIHDLAQRQAMSGSIDQ